MLWLVLSVLLVVGVGVCIVVAMAAAPSPTAGEMSDARAFAIAAIVLALIVEVGLTLGLSMAKLGTGQVGLEYNFAGKLVGIKQSPGLIFKAPWSSIRKESTQIQTEEFVLGADNAAVSRDQQPIYADLQINYQIDPNHVLDLYKNVGPNWRAKLVDSRVLQDFKEVTSTYPTIKITNSRELLRKETRDRLKAEFRTFADAPDAVQVADFFIRNIGFAKSYTDAIEAKQVQVQAAARAEAKVAQASAEAQQAVARAKGQAQAIALKGKALRNNPEVLQLEAIDKLNPNAQLIICTGSTCPSVLPTSLAGAAGGSGRK